MLIFHVFGVWLGTMGQACTIMLFLHHSDGDFGAQAGRPPTRFHPGMPLSFMLVPLAPVWGRVSSPPPHSHHLVKSLLRLSMPSLELSISQCHAPMTFTVNYSQLLLATSSTMLSL